ncbi:MAG TPA: hypothetical protein VIJ39_09380 [Solirubrobacteraceae bacterium]
MEANGLKEAGYRSAEAQRRRAVLARFLRMGVSDGGNSSSGDAATMGELETELALLREENAQLKVERHRPADAGHVIERMRSLRLQAPVEQQAEEGESAEVTHAIAECLVVREGLMQACQEVQQAMQGIRGRLGVLTGNVYSRSGERPSPERLAQPVVEAVEIEGAAPIDTSPEFAKSVA